MNKNGKGGKNTGSGDKFDKKTVRALRKDLIDKGYNLTNKEWVAKKNKTKDKSKSKKLRRYNFTNITKGGKSCGIILFRGEFINYLKNKDVNPKECVSKVETPDYVIIKGNDCYVVEVKYQNTPGSVDEKIETSGFKVKQYRKMVSELSLNVKYIYVFNDWFKQDKYKDALDYIEELGNKYVFNELKCSDIGL